MSAAVRATGKPVYGGGTFKPNQGQVSAQGAQGYLKRELAKKGKTGPFGGVSTFGNDKQSDTRSGVAASALKRQASAASTPKPAVIPPKETGGGKPAVWDSPTAAGSTVETPTVIVTDSGQLELPYNQQFSADVLSALEQHNQSLSELQIEQQNYGLQYAKDRRDADLNYSDLQRTTLATNAARGTAFSSAYGTAVGNNARAYQNQINDLDNAKALFDQQAIFRRSNIINAFNRLLSQAAMNNAGDLAEDAGNLGLTPDAPGGNNGNGGSSGYPDYPVIDPNAPINTPSGWTGKPIEQVDIPDYNDIMKHIENEKKKKKKKKSKPKPKKPKK